MNKDALAYANVHRLIMEATCQALQEALAVSVSNEVPLLIFNQQLIYYKHI